MRKRFLDFTFFLSILCLVVVYFFSETLEHHYFAFKNGNETFNKNAPKLNSSLLSVVKRDEDFILLKLKGYRISELNIGVIRPKDFLSELDLSDLKENVFVKNEQCIGMKSETDYLGSYEIILQNINTGFTFLLDKPLSNNELENLCKHSFID